MTQTFQEPMVIAKWIRIVKKDWSVKTPNVKVSGHYLLMLKGQKHKPINKKSKQNSLRQFHKKETLRIKQWLNDFAYIIGYKNGFFKTTHSYISYSI